MDISKMSETELKAMAFDEMQRRDIAVQNIELIMQELNKRRQDVMIAEAPVRPRKPKK